MKYVPPVGAETEDEAYTTGNPALGIYAKPVPHQAIEHPMREIMHAIEQAGLTPSEGDLTQLYQALVLIATAAAAPISDGDKGNIVVSGSGTIWTIKDGVITGVKIADGEVTGPKIATATIPLSKLANQAGNTFCGRYGAITGTPGVISAAQAQEMLGLLSAAYKDTGTAPGNIPVLDTDGLIPASSSRRGELSIGALTGLPSLALSGIPSWVRKIRVVLYNVAVSGDQPVLVRLITGSVITSGYVSSVGIARSGFVNAESDTSGFRVGYSTSMTGLDVTVELTRISSTQWSASVVGACLQTGIATGVSGGGRVSGLSGDVTGVQIQATGNNFTSGSVKVFYQ